MIPAYKDKNKGTWYASFYYENWMAIKEMKINRCFAAKREVLISRATTICEIRSQDVITWKNEMLNHRDKDGKSYSPIYLKTPKSNCVIQMPAFLCEKIQEYIKTLYTVRPTDRIFSVTKSYLYREIERGSKAAGVKRIRIHDLRHPYVKHTTKKYNSEKQKTQATKIVDLIAWGFCFCFVCYSKRSWTL